MKALLVGGTGPTGPHLAQGLLERGYEVAIFHRGVHEAPELPAVEHIHGDPHFRETIEEALAGQRFDLVLATYGRTRHLADVLAGRCDRFLAVGGIPGYRGFLNPEQGYPYGMKVNTAEGDDLVADPGPDGPPALRFAHLIAATEEHVFRHHQAGSFAATYFRYPLIYGPRQVAPPEWSVVKRVLDRRPFMILPDGGLAIIGRASARNAAHCVLLAVDQPEVAAGQIYNVADDEQLTLRQWFEIVAELVGGGPRMISLPEVIATPAVPLFPLGPSNHSLVSNSKAKLELDYSDVQPVREALREAVEWLLEHPMTPADNPGFRDPFDYTTEDRLVEAYKSMIELIQRDVPFDLPSVVHAYAHPKQSGREPDHRGR